MRHGFSAWGAWFLDSREDQGQGGPWLIGPVKPGRSANRRFPWETRRREDERGSRWIHPLAAPRETRALHLRDSDAGIWGALRSLTEGSCLNGRWHGASPCHAWVGGGHPWGRDMSWFYVKDGQRMGPVSEPQLRQKFMEGAVSDRTPVWREGMADWRPMGEVAGMGSMEAMGDGGGGGGAGRGRACVECGRSFAAEDMVELMGGTVCAGCKPVRLQRIREGAPVEGACSAYADGKLLVVLGDGELPRRCVCCNGPATGAMRRKFVWYPPWVNLLLLPGLVFAFIAVLFLQRQMSLEVPLCGAHQRRRRWRVLGCMAWMFASVFAIPVVASQRGGLAMAVSFVGVVSFLAALACGHLWWMVLSPRRITKDGGRFHGASEAFLASLPAWHGGGKA